MNDYLNSLIRKHRRLDTQIKKAPKSAHNVRQLKKLRLLLKDRIQHIGRQSAGQTARQPA